MSFGEFPQVVSNTSRIGQRFCVVGDEAFEICLDVLLTLFSNTTVVVFTQLQEVLHVPGTRALVTLFGEEDFLCLLFQAIHKYKLPFSPDLVQICFGIALFGVCLAVFYDL